MPRLRILDGVHQPAGSSLERVMCRMRPLVHDAGGCRGTGPRRPRPRGGSFRYGRGGGGSRIGGWAALQPLRGSARSVGRSWWAHGRLLGVQHLLPICSPIGRGAAGSASIPAGDVPGRRPGRLRIASGAPLSQLRGPLTVLDQRGGARHRYLYLLRQHVHLAPSARPRRSRRRPTGIAG
jgi:hypothetical protein